MSFEKGNKKEKNQNIQVFVRLRPLNQREQDIKSLGVVEVANNREVIIKQSQHNNHTKKFTFDRAFSPLAKQVEVYQEVVSPLIEEVLSGYNCTVFAYGQTGTGKTHTMVGESTSDELSWQNDPLAGIVPRALSQLFDELRLSNTEYTVRVSYLELYNEELFDLLSASPSMDNSKLRIYEDVTRKGSNIVNGLEEITVSNKNEVYKIMAQGQERKRVASTLMNAQSSRSHTVFTIVVHMRENSAEGEELVKIGKLNLVDLAGSENISKAGSDNPAKKERARECVNINQSLLTLGRVITALVERHPHIPYRESKLTRILQESLGGRTKTSIIATISPGHKDVEETMSTLEYANRAKNIQNKPEVNQKMTKKAILKEYVEEIDRLKRDLQAARDKNGVYLATDTYTEITLKQEEQRKEIQELLLQKRAVEEQKDKVENLFSELNKTLEKNRNELTQTISELSSVKTKLANTANLLESTKQDCAEQKHLVEERAATEQKLLAQAREIMGTAHTAAKHAWTLHDTVEKRKTVESSNLQVTANYRSQASQHRANLSDNTTHFTLSLTETLTGLLTAFSEMAENNAGLGGERGRVEEMLALIRETVDEIKTLTGSSHEQLVAATEEHRCALRAAADSNLRSLSGCVLRVVQRAAHAVEAARAAGLADRVAAHLQEWNGGCAGRVSNLRTSHAALSSSARASQRARAAALAAQREAARQRKEENDMLLQTLNEKIEGDESELTQRIHTEVESIEAERRQLVERLQRWAEAEQTRVQEYVRAETEALETRISEKLHNLEQSRVAAAARVSAATALAARLRAAGEEALRAADRELEAAERALQADCDALGATHEELQLQTSAMSTQIDELSTQFLAAANQLQAELISAVEQAHLKTEDECKSLVNEIQCSGEQLCARSGAALDGVLGANRTVLDDVVNKIEATNSSTTHTLQQVSSSLASISSVSSSLLSSASDSVEQVSSQVSLFEESVRNSVRSLEEAEGRCLSQEYQVYSPSGNTPARTEYRLPRALVATSPQERILARFRAMRQNSFENENECIVVESDNESVSESLGSSSSVCEEVGVFAEPPPRTPLPAPIVKCTSETDIYAYKRTKDDGKENANRSMNYKKPSKLPAPSSLKKPFLDRNINDNGQ